jgi:hypothetical protein
MQVPEERHDKEMAIVLRNFNKHIEQILLLGKEKHGSQATIHGLNEVIPLEVSHASCEVVQPLQSPPTTNNQGESQAIVDT